ncbi:VanW family protein [Plantactinospora sp. GCM10030261]|uniref:VanW family protein n=1 Tax=Plantactinospora sp. GCM10030261 TaxID=3273420 RepID=UPI00360B9D38
MPADDSPTVTFPAVPPARTGTDAGPARPGAGAPPTAPDAAPTDADTGPPGSWTGRLGRRRTLLAAGVAVVVLLVGGVVAYRYAGDVPRGTTVLGIELGGKSRAEAAEALRAGLSAQADRLSAPVPVRVGEQAGEVSPADVDLRVDVDATVAAAAETPGNPLSVLFGSREVQPVVAVDPAKLDEVLRGRLGDEARPMTMPAITFSGTTPQAVHPEPGRGLDPERSAGALRDGWLGAHPVPVPLVDLHPATSAEEVDRLVAEVATPAVAGPVTVTTDRGEVTVPPTAIAKSLVLTADKTGKINPRVDGKKLRAALAGPLGKVEVAAKNASVAIVSGKPVVSAGTEGRQVDTEALARDLLPVLSKADDRTVTGTMRTAAPDTTTEDIAKLGIKERVSTFTTKFTGGLSSPRSQNIVQAAKEVDGALVKPGATFSLNKHTGERGYAQGYKDAPVILDGKLVPGVGGGVSQFTTTLFNAAYYAGLEDVEHKPHSYYFSRYPSVIESTIFYPDLDMKFRNDTEYGIVIDTSYTANSITVSMWSTKVYDSVKTEWSPRRNVVAPKTVELPDGPTCISASGSVGFTQDAYRVFRKGGQEIRRQKFTWRYDAEPRFVCVKKPA